AVARLYLRAPRSPCPKRRVLGLPVRATHIPSPKGRLPQNTRPGYKHPVPKGTGTRDTRPCYNHSVPKGTGTPGCTSALQTFCLKRDGYPATNIWSNGAWIGALIQVCLHVRTRWHIHKCGAHDNRGTRLQIVSTPRS